MHPTVRYGTSAVKLEPVFWAQKSVRKLIEFVLRRIKGWCHQMQGRVTNVAAQYIGGCVYVRMHMSI